MLLNYFGNPTQVRALVRIQAMIRGRAARVALKQSSNSRRRTEIAKEIFETEKSYVKYLNVLLRVFLEPMKKEEDVISAQDVRFLFSQVEVIKNYNELILNKLAKRMGQWYQEEGKLGDIFLSMVTAVSPVLTTRLNSSKCIQSM